MKEKISELRRMYDAANGFDECFPHSLAHCHGHKCRLSWCASCCEYFEAEEALRSIQSKMRAASAMHNALPALLDRLEALEEVLREAIKWDGHDAEGEPALWLDRAESALEETK